jgi:CubicO group peptidase (beta-lactamase class C family)/pimeloyl-ACP methyl ester carboxylesterase
MFSRVTGLCVLLAIGSYSFAQTQTLPPGMPEVIRDLDSAASEAVKNPNDIGYTLGVVTRNGLAWTKSYGFADSGRTQPARAETEYRIGTAAFTAIMLLQLVRDGKAHLSDPAEKYVTELKSVRSQYPDAAPVTLMQLALHTSGLSVGPMGANSNGAVMSWDKTLLTALPTAQYAFEPGTHAAASPIEDAVLALALSRAAGRPYDEYVKERMLAPLGMSQSHFSTDSRGVNPVVQTTIGDVARFASFLMLGGPESVLTRNELEENYRRVWVGNSVALPNPSEWFGIGYDGESWTSNHYYFIPSIGSPQPGFDATFWFEPRRHAGVILLHQGTGGGALGQMIHTYVYTLNAQKVDAGRQEPVKPLPYTEEEVSFDNKAAEIKLAGSLTIPPGAGPFPAVVLIPKAGPIDRDERILNHRPFLVLADYLTRAGIAVLRTDVRGAGKSGGKFAGAQAADFAGDAEAALEYLRTRKEVDSSRVGLISHGEGGRVAGTAAARNRNAGFVVMLGAAAVPLAANLVEGSRLSAEAGGELYAKAEAQASLTREVYSIILRDSDPATLEKRLRDSLAGKLPESQITAQMRQWTSAAFRTAMSYDPGPELKQIPCPVLALYAEKDFTVPAKLNVPAMRAALAGNKAAEVEELPDLNLLFQTADVGAGREANWAEETMSPIVLKRIADWVAGPGSRR